MSKRCLVCGKRAYSDYCVTHKPRKPIAVRTMLKRPTKPIRQQGKLTKEWLVIRKEWFKAHPAEYYVCKLRISPLCHKVMPKNETTLDHIINKSNAKNYDNRHDFSNLQPACYPCNGEKGSRH